MFLKYVQVSVSNTVLHWSDIVAAAGGAAGMPDDVYGAQLQADTANIRFCMCPQYPTSSIGMLLLTTEPPATYLMEDMLNIRFISVSGTAKLNVHLFSGRQIP